MTEPTQPEWLKGFVPTPAPPGGRFQKGESGNPRGRPRGIVDKRQKLQKVFADDAEAIIKAVIKQAIDGDMTAANIALARIAPPLKAQAERVQFELSPDAPLSDQAQQVLTAVSEGKLDAETGKLLVGCIQSVANIKAVEDLENRIILLEAKAV
jgi:hypothetical protein